MCPPELHVTKQGEKAMASDYEVKQAIGIVARLGGYAIKRVATTDDLKDRSLTITLTRVSDGWVQESMSFEDIPPLVATVDGTNGHVDRLDGLQPGDLAETGEEADREINDRAAAALEGELAEMPQGQTFGQSAEVPVATTVPTSASTTGTVLELAGKKKR